MIEITQEETCGVFSQVGIFSGENNNHTPAFLYLLEYLSYNQGKMTKTYPSDDCLCCPVKRVTDPHLRLQPQPLYSRT